MVRGGKKLNGWMVWVVFNWPRSFKIVQFVYTICSLRVQKWVVASVCLWIDWMLSCHFIEVSDTLILWASSIILLTVCVCVCVCWLLIKWLNDFGKFSHYCFRVRSRWTLHVLSFAFSFLLNRPMRYVLRFSVIRFKSVCGFDCLRFTSKQQKPPFGTAMSFFSMYISIYL